MDPLSALSVAAAVVQFVDFGTRLLTTSFEIYKSPTGQTSAEVEAATALNDFRGLAERVKHAIAESGAPPRPDIAKILEDMDALVTMFGDAMKPRATTGGASSKKQTLRSALKSLRNVPRTNLIFLPKLRAIQYRMMQSAIIDIWAQAKSHEQQAVHFSTQLDKMTATLGRLEGHGIMAGDETAGGQPVDHHGIDAQVAQILDSQLNFQTTAVFEELKGHLWTKQGEQRSGQTEWGLQTWNEASASTRAAFCKLTMEKLAFINIWSREEAVSKAFERTFSWIFDTQPARARANMRRSSFPSWLEGSSPEPYWITGKPGSGKSTLMKYLLQSPQLAVHLEKWAAGSPLLVASYYAWISGSDMQKSLEGLLKTILHQSLSKDPTLAYVLAPRRWSFYTVLKGSSKQPSWSPWELEESLAALLSQCAAGLKLVIFIDGLDEFEVPPVQLLDVIRRLYSSDGVKVCVASREWTEFEDALNTHPMLRMQDLTESDMALFVKQRFEANRGFLQLTSVFPEQCAALMGDVVRKSSGVFLWLSLVVTMLVEAFTEGAGLTELQETVDGLPDDIALLYNRIWTGISPRNLAAASVILAIVQAAAAPLSTLLLWLADEDPALDFDAYTMTEEAIRGVAGIMKRRLDARTRGILEIAPDDTVNFLHRTAKDWAAGPEVSEALASHLPPDFDATLRILKARIIAMDHIVARSESCWVFHDECLMYAYCVADSPVNRPKLTAALDLLERKTDAARKRPDVTWPGTLGTSGAENTFLGFAAQFCLGPYLLVKLAEDPDLARVKVGKGHLSLLENAVMGPRYGSNVQSLPLSHRIRVVSFLLERGAPANQIAHDGNPLIEVVESQKEWNRHSDEMRYWEEMGKVLKSYSGLSMKSLRVSFRRMIGR